MWLLLTTILLTRTGLPYSTTAMAAIDQPLLAGLGLSFVHQNVQSLLPKIDEMRLIIENSFSDFFSISETWLTSKITDAMVNISGYKLICHDRATHRRGGGLATYIRNDISTGVDALKYCDLWLSNFDIEAQVLELKIRNIKKSILINVYRPPNGKYQNFVESLEKILNSILHIHEFEIFVMRDCNIPYNQSNSPSVKQLKNFESKFGLQQIITAPPTFRT